VEEIVRAVSAIVISERGRKQMSRIQFSNFTGVSVQTIERVETDGILPSLKTLNKLLKPLGYAMVLQKMK